MLKDKKFWRLLFWFTVLIILIYQIDEHQSLIKLNNKNTVEFYRKKLYKISKGNLGSKNIEVGFFEKFTKPRTIGFCTFDFEKLSFVIGIKKSYWEESDFRQRLLLLAHEYGHCDCLKWGHINKLLWDGCPEHFMYHVMPHNYCVKKYWKMYERQFYTSCQKLRRYR